ncbi:hypothetical protein QTP88_005352 [Uroleucon formosanum]
MTSERSKISSEQIKTSIGGDVPPTKLTWAGMSNGRGSTCLKFKKKMRIILNTRGFMTIDRN